jgi:hypothetical protein
MTGQMGLPSEAFSYGKLEDRVLPDPQGCRQKHGPATATYQRMKKTFLLLGFTGAFLVGLATYLQAASMHLSRFDLWGLYLKRAIENPDARAIVLYPFLVGSVYLAAALICLLRRPRPFATFFVVIGCALLAVLLLMFSPFGIPALVYSALLFVFYFAERRELIKRE